MLKINNKYTETLEWRNTGPFRGGRVVAAAGDPEDQMVFYFGACGGGVWKTEDGGVIWEGYFVASRTGPHTFNTWTTAYTTFDFNLDGYEEDLDKNQTPTSIAAVGAGNTYKEWARVGITTTFDGNSASADSNTLTIKADFSKTIGVGMSVSGTGLVSGLGGNGEQYGQL